MTPESPRAFEIGQAVGRAFAYIGVVQAIAVFIVFWALPLAWLQITRGIERGVIDECLDDSACVPEGLPLGRLPVWMAYAWVAVPVIGVIVCWSSRRWWAPTPMRGTRIPRVWTGSAPEWPRLFLIMNAFVLAGVVLPSSAQSGVFAPAYFGPAALALLGALAAWIAVRAGAASVPAPVLKRLRAVGSPLLPAERRRRNASARPRRATS